MRNRVNCSQIINNWNAKFSGHFWNAKAIIYQSFLNLHECNFKEKGNISKKENLLMSFFLSLFLFWNRKGLALVTFWNATVWCFLKTFRKYVAWCKNSRVIKDLSKSGSFYLLSVPAHFSRIFEKYSSQKNPKNWKSFFVKISFLRNFINDIRDVTCNEVLINLVNLCDKRVGEWSS